MDKEYDEDNVVYKECTECKDLVDDDEYKYEAEMCKKCWEKHKCKHNNYAKECGLCYRPLSITIMVPTEHWWVNSNHVNLKDEDFSRPRQIISMYHYFR